MAILDKGYDLTLRPMKYPDFYNMYLDAIKNTWSVGEVDFSTDVMDLLNKITPSERHMIQRLVAFFATGDAIVSDNLVINLYTNINSPEARMYLSRQLFEEAQHIQFYLTLLDTYITNEDERAQAFSAIENIPSIKLKADFCERWMAKDLNGLLDKKDFLRTLICFASCVEGLFFYGAFAYVYFMRSKGLLNGLAAGTNWVFRDESCHMNFAFNVVDVVRQEEPELFTPDFKLSIMNMIDEAIHCETVFAQDVLQGGIVGLSISDMNQYLKYVGNQRLVRLGFNEVYNVKNPFAFMEAQDIQELSNFFERRSTAYQATVSGSVDLNAAF